MKKGKIQDREMGKAKMGIVINHSENIFLLQTRSNSYAFGIDDQGLVRHLYWEKRINEVEDFELPEIQAKHVDAAIIHEAAIGRINDEQLLKLRTLGMTEAEAENVIIENFLS